MDDSLFLEPPATGRGAMLDLGKAVPVRLTFFVCYDGFWGRARFLQIFGATLIAAIDLGAPDVFGLALELVSTDEAQQMLAADAWIVAGGNDEQFDLDLVSFLKRLREHTRSVG